MSTTSVKPTKPKTQRPNNEIEAAVKLVVERVVQITNVGMTDKFFDIGATSFNIIDICAQLNELCDNQLAITDLFTFPCVRLLSDHISTLIETASTAPIDSTPELQQDDRLRYSATLKSRKKLS